MGRDDWFNLLPNSDNQIFNRGLLSLHPWNIHVQVAMIEWLLDMLMDDGFEVCEVDEVTRFLVNDATDCDMHLVVVTMPIRMGTFAKYFEIFRCIPMLIPEFVGCVESRATGDGFIFVRVTKIREAPVLPLHHDCHYWSSWIYR